MGSAEQQARDKRLRAAVLRGDESAWQAWYDEAFEPLWAYVLWRTGRDRPRTEEIVQETWLVAVRRIRAFDPERASFVSWLRGVAANLIRNEMRKLRTTRQRLEPLEHDPQGNEDTHGAWDEQEQSRRIMEALAGLPDRYKAVLRAKYLDDLTTSAIAEAWNETPKAIESLLVALARHFEHSILLNSTPARRTTNQLNGRRYTQSTTNHR